MLEANSPRFAKKSEVLHQFPARHFVGNLNSGTIPLKAVNLKTSFVYNHVVGTYIERRSIARPLPLAGKGMDMDLGWIFELVP